MKISTLVAAVALAGLLPAAWACDYEKPTDASVAAPAQMASVGAPARAQAVAPDAVSKASMPSAVKLGAAGQKQQAQPIAVACTSQPCN